MQHYVTETRHAVEVDAVTTTGSWSLRSAERPDGACTVIVVDPSSARPVVAELLDGDRTRPTPSASSLCPRPALRCTPGHRVGHSPSHRAGP
jgi:hypothetical protein